MENTLYYFFFTIIIVLIIVNVWFSRNNTESFQNINNGITLNNSSMPSVDNGVVIDDTNTLTIDQQINNQFNTMAESESDFEKNNELINKEINKTIIDQEIQAEELLSQEEVFGKDEIDNEIPLKKPEKLVNESQNFKDMFQKLEDAEYLCNSIERRQKLKNDLEQMKINELAIKELDKQDQQIEELKNVLKNLRIEEARRNRIINTCNNNKQKKLNDNYDTIKKLVKNGELPKKNTNINFNLPKINIDNLSQNFKNFKNLTSNSNSNSNTSNNTSQNTSSNCKKCSNIDTSKMIHKDKLKNSVCLGCDKKILDNKDIIRNF